MTIPKMDYQICNLLTISCNCSVRNGHMKEKIWRADNTDLSSTERIREEPDKGIPGAFASVFIASDL